MEFIGEMTEDNFPDQAIRDWTMSVASGLENETETARDTVVLKKLVESLEAMPDTTNATMGYFKYVNAAYTSPGGSATDGAKLFDLTTGMLCLSVKGGLMMDEVRRGGVEDELYDAMFADSGEAQFIPFGFGSHVGIAELANPKYQKTYPKLHADAVQAMRSGSSHRLTTWS